MKIAKLIFIKLLFLMSVSSFAQIADTINVVVPYQNQDLSILTKPSINSLLKHNVILNSKEKETTLYYFLTLTKDGELSTDSISSKPYLETQSLLDYFEFTPLNDLIFPTYRSSEPIVISLKIKKKSQSYTPPSLPKILPFITTKSHGNK